MNETTSRRAFVGSAAAGLLIAKPETVRGSQANSALSIGVVGLGNRGGYVSGIFAKNEFARIAAICDIYEDRITEAQKQFSGAKTFRNIKDLLASDVDAVYIATPVHLHPEHFEAAVNARKHIFMEKPAGVDVAGCKRVLEAAKRADKTKRISVDFQQRYGKEYNAAYDMVKKGELGPIRMIRAAWLGSGPMPRKGHAESEEKVRNWYFYRALSGDMIVEQDCHNIDVVNWFMGTHPTKVTGYGGQAVRKYGDVMDNLACTFTFADGTVFSYAADQFSTGAFQDVSETFLCDKGTINTSRTGYKLWNSPKRGAPPIDVPTKYDITADAVNQFIEGARTGKLENAGQWAAESTLTAIMAREAIYTGREVTWDRLVR
jgi:myo-inositol 2-dehydrogenase / D-chiro-inositol 1-dehydrogenase